MSEIRRREGERERRGTGDALLEVVDGHVLEVDLLRAVDVGRVGEDAQGHARARDVREPIPPSFPHQHPTPPRENGERERT